MITFIVVSDIMKWARNNDVVVGTRGSAGGSLVAYCLDIANNGSYKMGAIF